MSKPLLLSDAASEIMRREGLTHPPEVWRIRRLFELGILPEPGRLSNGYRFIDPAMLPLVASALAAKGWLDSPVKAEAAG